MGLINKPADQRRCPLCSATVACGVIEHLRSDHHRTEAEARALDQELARLRAAYGKASPAQRVALQEPKRRAKEQRASLRQEIRALKRAPGSDSDRLQTLAALTETGDGAPTAEQAQLVHRLVQRVDYNGVQGKLTIVLRQHEKRNAG